MNKVEVEVEVEVEVDQANCFHIQKSFLTKVFRSIFSRTAYFAQPRADKDFIVHAGFKPSAKPQTGSVLSRVFEG